MTTLAYVILRHCHTVRARLRDVAVPSVDREHVILSVDV